VEKGGFRNLRLGVCGDTRRCVSAFIPGNPGRNTSAASPSSHVAAAIPQPDYIEGTQFTRMLMDDRFPFGYAIFFVREGDKLVHEVSAAGRLQWDINWDNVKIEPDFAAQKVKWTIPQYRAKNKSANFSIDAAAIDITPFSVGNRACSGYLSLTDPLPFLGILSDNQRSPVFIIGFRVATAKDFKWGDF
jgi:hypothetical protein